MKKFLTILILLSFYGCKNDDSTVAVAVSTPTASQDAPVQLPVGNINFETKKPGAVLTFTGPRVADITENQWVWVQPWTMWVTSKGEHFINGTHPYYTQSQPNFIQVNRSGSSFYVSLSGTKFIWTPLEMDVTPGYLETMPVKSIQN